MEYLGINEFLHLVPPDNLLRHVRSQSFDVSVGFLPGDLLGSVTYHVNLTIFFTEHGYLRVSIFDIVTILYDNLVEDYIIFYLDQVIQELDISFKRYSHS